MTRGLYTRRLPYYLIPYQYISINNNNTFHAMVLKGRSRGAGWLLYFLLPNKYYPVFFAATCPARLYATFLLFPPIEIPNTVYSFKNSNPSRLNVPGLLTKGLQQEAIDGYLRWRWLEYFLYSYFDAPAARSL